MPSVDGGGGSGGASDAFGAVTVCERSAGGVTFVWATAVDARKHDASTRLVVDTGRDRNMARSISEPVK
jgi:hypothetical protein